MGRLTRLLFGRSGGAAVDLPEDVAAALKAWQERPAADLSSNHFQCRYVAVDVATSGLTAGEDFLLSIAGVGMTRGGVISPDDAFSFDLPKEPGPDLDRRLMAFLQFCDKAPLVTYQAPFVGAFLEQAFQERLGVSFKVEWIDLAWLLQDLFKERFDAMVKLDDWLGSFGIEVPGRRDALADAVALARLFQACLARGKGRGADTPGKLMDIARARRFLRQSA